MKDEKGGGIAQPLGSLSKRYESTGDPGAIANNKGDIGGASYGSYQIATNTGTMSTFLNFAAKVAPKVASVLQGKSPGSDAFNKAWTSLAKTDPVGFDRVQHQFIQATHFEPVVKRVASLGLNVMKRTPALQNAVWSTAVHHGVGGAYKVLQAALSGNTNLTDEQLIRRIYAERGANNGMKYFSSSSDAIRKSVVNRFHNEMKDALRML